MDALLIYLKSARHSSHSHTIGDSLSLSLETWEMRSRGIVNIWNLIVCGVCGGNLGKRFFLIIFRSLSHSLRWKISATSEQSSTDWIHDDEVMGSACVDSWRELNEHTHERESERERSGFGPACVWDRGKFGLGKNSFSFDFELVASRSGRRVSGVETVWKRKSADRKIEEKSIRRRKVRTAAAVVRYLIWSEWKIKWKRVGEGKFSSGRESESCRPDCVWVSKFQLDIFFFPILRVWHVRSKCERDKSILTAARNTIRKSTENFMLKFAATKWSISIWAGETSHSIRCRWCVDSSLLSKSKKSGNLKKKKNKAATSSSSSMRRRRRKIVRQMRNL